MARNRSVPISSSPAAFSIRMAAERSGIGADTLRAWERRYGFPVPLRRAGGSRLYDEATIEQLRLIARALDEGFRAGEVVPLGRADIVKLLNTASEPLPKPSAVTIDGLVDELLADNLSRLQSLLRNLALTHGPRQFVTDVAHPFMRRVGDLWKQGELEIRHEHLASACLTAQLKLVCSANAGESAAGAPRVLLTTLPHERHVLGLDMVAAYLISHRIDPHLLGGETPVDQIVKAAEALRVQAVGLTMSEWSATTDDAMASSIRKLEKKLSPAIELWLGGEGARRMSPHRESTHRLLDWASLDVACKRIG